MANVSVSAEGGKFTIDVRFGDGVEPVSHVFDQDMPAATLQAAIRIGLTNMVRDAMAGKAGDEQEARQAAADKLKRLIAGDVSGAARGPKATPEQRIRNEYVRGLIEAKLPKEQRPTTAKGWAELIEQVCSGRHADAIAKEVKRRVKAAMEVDLGL